MVVIFKLRFFIYLIIAILLIGAVSLYFLINPAEANIFPPCPFHTVTGLYCPGCGSQRAIHDILNGNLLQGFGHNYLFLLLFFVLGYEALTWIRAKCFNKTTYNLINTSKFTIAVLVVVLVFWCLRNLPFYPFTMLAP
ncbi:hypothetical protein IA57_00215 [Mangrovimonas yunxiaonensis]|uniref:DUF2752 domain-containing protein n=1 Tax=Mangrovimonas yunxiaonensis TaxID=1197477 RepID=A0A084TP34_9FLAO|nr:DUF2752 domain-containing protein [Mangrovimonas yunxiaonensis]KFB02470.1 hypothetical protein IA57_00215 [Mangrovimonas yunxiaonensis]GGH47928.1 membrane protein [Mangrovimonas yunxiaonensis]